MNKKFKYTSLVAAGAVTLGLVGGTLAWFTSQDVETNNFSTVGNNQGGDNDDSSIKIVEDWLENGMNLTPKTTVNKDVQVKNVDNYDQFIKVNLKVKVQKPVYKVDAKGKYELDANGNLQIEDWTTEYKNVVKENNTYCVDDYEEITLQFTNHLTSDLALGTWYYQLDSITEEKGDTVTTTNFSNFYYIGKVAAGSHTNTLLDSVTLTENAEETYKNIKFDVIVTADGIQTTNDAAKTVWRLSGNLADKYADTQLVANPVDVEEGDNVKDNDNHNHTTENPHVIPTPTAPTTPTTK